MNRRDRENYNRNNYGLDYDRYEDYNRGNDRYGEQRNLTNQFEREYQRDRNQYQNDSNNYRSEGYMESSYNQYRREEGGFRDHADGDRREQSNQRNFSDNFSRDRDRFSNYQDNFRGDQGIDRNSSDRYREDDRGIRGNIRQGYGISGFDGTSDRFNTLNSEDRYGTEQDEQSYYSGARDGYRSSRFGGGMGDTFPGSHRGVPDYGIRNFSDDYGVGMGSSYGGKNYGGGTGYASGHRGGTLGNSSYGTTSGNFGGYGPMGGSTYGGGRGSSVGNTAHNSDRMVNELGGH